MEKVKPIYMSVSDAARRYGIGRNLLYEIMAMNEAPETLKIGKKRLLPIAEYDKFFEDTFSTKS